MLVLSCLMLFLCLCTSCFSLDLPSSPFVSVYVHREQVQRSEESRQQSMKPSPSQHSFDSAILDGSLPDENLSVDSDISDNFVVLLDSGV